MKKRYTEEQIIKAIKQHEAGSKVEDLCREMGISVGTFNNWRSKHADLEMTETELFNRWKETLIRRHGDSDHEFVIQAHANLVEAYKRFKKSNCADPTFLKEICSHDLNKSAQRLGEMLLYDRLSHAFPSEAISSKAHGPDFLVEVDGRRIWLELITTTIGDDARIKELDDNYDPLNPSAEDSTELRKRHLLRITNAIDIKLKVYQKYLDEKDEAKRRVMPDDALIIVVNDAGLCPDIFGFGALVPVVEGVSGRPLIEEAVLGIGSVRGMKTEGKEGYVFKHTYRNEIPNRPEPTKLGERRKPVPVDLFTPSHNKSQIQHDPKIVSALMQVTLREEYGLFMHLRHKAETEDRLGEMLLPEICVIVPNPTAFNQIDLATQRKLIQKTNLKPLSEKEAVELMGRHSRFLFSS